MVPTDKRENAPSQPRLHTYANGRHQAMLSPRPSHVLIERSSRADIGEVPEVR